MDMSSFECIVKKIALAGRWKSGRKILFPFDYIHKNSKTKKQNEKIHIHKKDRIQQKTGICILFPWPWNVLHLTHTYSQLLSIYGWSSSFSQLVLDDTSRATIRMRESVGEWLRGSRGKSWDYHHIIVEKFCIAGQRNIIAMIEFQIFIQNKTFDLLSLQKSSLKTISERMGAFSKAWIKQITFSILLEALYSFCFLKHWIGIP